MQLRYIPQYSEKLGTRPILIVKLPILRQKVRLGAVGNPAIVIANRHLAEIPVITIRGATCYCRTFRLARAIRVCPDRAEDVSGFGWTIRNGKLGSIIDASVKPDFVLSKWQNSNLTCRTCIGGRLGVRGHVRCHNLVIDEGGIINGSVKFISAESPHSSPI